MYNIYVVEKYMNLGIFQILRYRYCFWVFGKDLKGFCQLFDIGYNF